MATLKMTTEEILNELKGNYTNFKLSATHEDLVNLGWYFDEEEGEHKGLYLTGEGDKLQVCATTERNDSYTIAHNLEEIGGMEGVEDLLKIGGFFSHDKSQFITI